MFTYQNAAFIQSMFELVTSQNFALLQNFKSVHLLGVSLLDEQDFTVRALADDFDCAEVAHGHSTGTCD